MSFFGSLGKTRQTTRETVDTSGLPEYSYRSLLDKDEIGEGGFAVVFTAKLPDNGEKIMVKKLLRKLLVKEARLLSKLQHPNIVRFKGVCLDKFAVLLEYVYFNYDGITLHSLASFLVVCEQSNCRGIHCSVFINASSDIASGLKYLHENSIAHRNVTCQDFTSHCVQLCLRYSNSNNR